MNEFGENAIFQSWEFIDVPADELQENDVIAFLCDGDIGDLIVVTNKARIYKFNWGHGITKGCVFFVDLAPWAHH